MSEYFLTSRREYSSAELKKLTSRWVDAGRVPTRFRVITDTSDFFRVEYDDVLLLNGRPYLVRNNEKEGRFGLDDEPKFWVRRSIDLLDGKEKIIKMVFHEHFKVRVGKITFDCVRSPQKEARILETVKGHPHFMQGFSVRDSAGNDVRIIDFIKGRKLFHIVP